MRGGSSSKAYVAAFLGGVVAMVVAVVASLEFLQAFAPDHLPPPAISNRIDLDEKLLFIRRHRDWEPTTLGIGSSITMRSLDGAPFSEGLPQRNRFINVAFGGAQLHQVQTTGLFYLDLFPTVRTVIQLVVPPDFQDCTTVPSELFDPADARAFALGKMSPVQAYLKYFNPHELIPQAFQIAAARRNTSGGAVGGRLYTDPFGSMPMTMSPREARRRHDVLYTETPALDPACFRALIDWSRQVQLRGVRLVIVVPPFSPIFLRQIDGAPEYIDAFVQKLRSALRNTPAALIDERPIAFGDEAYADAYHLLWPAARVFSRHVSDDLKQFAAGSSKGGSPGIGKAPGYRSDTVLGWPRS
jgi:hypothetical protein